MKNFYLDSLPVYWRIKKNKKNKIKNIPTVFEYRFKEIKNINLLIEKRSKRLLKFLNEIYKKESNIGFFQEGHTMAKGYGDDFLRFLYKQIKNKKIFDILEIGCGSCFILKKLKKDGFNVIGLDPSPLTIKKASKDGIKVYKGFFPNPKIKEKFDLIFHIDVLEHVPQPIQFLKDMRKKINNSGYMIIKVPDCTDSVKNGDISFITHQHVNNFTQNSLKNLVKFCGFKILKFEKSKFGSSLYCFAKKQNVVDKVRLDNSENQKFFEKIEDNINNFKKVIHESISKNRSIGFYVPLRAFPYIYYCRKIIRSYRLFDDTSHYRNNFFDGCDVKIENFNDLVKNPVDHLFIMSFPFGKKIRSRVINRIPSQRITLLEDFLNY